MFEFLFDAKVRTLQERLNASDKKVNSLESALEECKQSSRDSDAKLREKIDKLREYAFAHKQHVKILTDLMADKFPETTFNIYASTKQISAAYTGLYSHIPVTIIEWKDGPTLTTVENTISIRNVHEVTEYSITYNRIYDEDLVLDVAQGIASQANINVDVNINNIKCLQVAGCSLFKLANDSLDLQDLRARVA